MAAKTSDPPPPYPGTGVSSSAPEPSQPCPNGCETGALSKGLLREHLQDCPLQLVDCEFANAGCDVKVPRRDLARHMTENAQHHLMSATLLNLRLTKELHQKMEEKDRQIAHLQRQIETLSMEEKDRQIADLQRQVEKNGFICHKLILRDFKAHQGKSAAGEWYSDIVSDGLGIFKVQLQIDTNGSKPRLGHMTATLKCLDMAFDLSISEIGYLRTYLIVTLHMLNQLGDYGHHVVMTLIPVKNKSKSVKLSQYNRSNHNKYFPLSELGYSSTTATQYLINNELHFKLYLKVDFGML